MSIYLFIEASFCLNIVCKNIVSELGLSYTCIFHTPIPFFKGSQSQNIYLWSKQNPLKCDILIHATWL